MTAPLRTCPLLDAARLHPEVVCQVHLGLVAGALEAHREPSDGLRLAPFSRPGAASSPCPPHWCDDRRPPRRDDRGPGSGPRRGHGWAVGIRGCRRRGGLRTGPRRGHGWVVGIRGCRRHRRGARRRHLPAVRGRQARRAAARSTGARDCRRVAARGLARRRGGTAARLRSTRHLDPREARWWWAAGRGGRRGAARAHPAGGRGGRRHAVRRARPGTAGGGHAHGTPGGRRGGGDACTPGSPTAVAAYRTSAVRAALPIPAARTAPRSCCSRCPTSSCGSPDRPAATSTPPPTSTTSTTSRGAPTPSDRSPSTDGC